PTSHLVDDRVAHADQEMNGQDLAVMLGHEQSSIATGREDLPHLLVVLSWIQREALPVCGRDEQLSEYRKIGSVTFPNQHLEPSGLAYVAPGGLVHRAEERLDRLMQVDASGCHGGDLKSALREALRLQGRPQMMSLGRRLDREVPDASLSRQTVHGREDNVEDI